MKRVQIIAEVFRNKSFKVKLFGRRVHRIFKPRPPIEEDPLWDLVGDIDADPEPVDDVVYPR